MSRATLDRDSLQGLSANAVTDEILFRLIPERHITTRKQIASQQTARAFNSVARDEVQIFRLVKLKSGVIYKKLNIKSIL
jgi:hypothetical protein